MKFKAIILRTILLVIIVLSFVIGILAFFAPKDAEYSSYVLFACAAVGFGLLLVINIGPCVLINDSTEELQTKLVFDEGRKFKYKFGPTFDDAVRANGELIGRSFVIIPLKEIVSCKIHKKQLLLDLKWDAKKTLYLTWFTKKQIKKIKYELDKRIAKNV